LRRELNALPQNQFPVKTEKILPMCREVTDNAAAIHCNYGKCCSFRRFFPSRHHHEIANQRLTMQGKAQIDQVLRQMSETSEIPGVVAISANSKEVIYQGAHGKRDLSKDDAMTLDSVFWIASMTKAITAAAAMQLVERGTLSLDAPIGKLLPDLAAPQVLEGFDAKGEPRLRPANKPMTLRHLLTHTAGFSYPMWNGDMQRYLDKSGTPSNRTGLNASLRVEASPTPITGSIRRATSPA
jgi:CubicO group peptidase (beta-lactamase class C family)